MKVREEYKTPEVVEYLITSPLNLMFEMSAELPDGADEGDPDTFSPVELPA